MTSKSRLVGRTLISKFQTVVQGKLILFCLGVFGLFLAGCPGSESSAKNWNAKIQNLSLLETEKFAVFLQVQSENEAGEVVGLVQEEILAKRNGKFSLPLASFDKAFFKIDLEGKKQNVTLTLAMRHMECGKSSECRFLIVKDFETYERARTWLSNQKQLFVSKIAFPQFEVTDENNVAVVDLANSRFPDRLSVVLKTQTQQADFTHLFKYFGSRLIQKDAPAYFMDTVAPSDAKREVILTYGSSKEKGPSQIFFPLDSKSDVVKIQLDDSMLERSSEEIRLVGTLHIDSTVLLLGTKQSLRLSAQPNCYPSTLKFRAKVFHKSTHPDLDAFLDNLVVEGDCGENGMISLVSRDRTSFRADFEIQRVSFNEIQKARLLGSVAPKDAPFKLRNLRISSVDQIEKIQLGRRSVPMSRPTPNRQCGPDLTNEQVLEELELLGSVRFTELQLRQTSSLFQAAVCGGPSSLRFYIDVDVEDVQAAVDLGYTHSK